MPVPVAVKDIVPAPVLIVPPSTIAELVPVSINDTAPLLLVVNPVSVMVAELAESVKLIAAGLLVTLDTLTLVAVSVTQILPVEFNDTVPALVEMLVPTLPMLPEPEMRFSVPVVVNAPLV